MDADTLNRFLAKVEVSDGDSCWEWLASRTADGYGKFRVPGVGVRRAHRLMYENQIGLIPEGLQLDHLCRNRGCVRPDHLEPVTSAENTRRGERNTPKTHCPSGHEYSVENTFHVKATGRRFCRTCHTTSCSEAQRRRRKARR